MSAEAGTIFWWACGNFVLLFGFCLFEKNCWARALNFLISRRACAVFCWSWTFEASCWAFVAHVGAVVTGANFVELARSCSCVGVVLSGSAVGLS